MFAIIGILTCIQPACLPPSLPSLPLFFPLSFFLPIFPPFLSLPPLSFPSLPFLPSLFSLLPLYLPSLSFTPLLLSSLCPLSSLLPSLLLSFPSHSPHASPCRAIRTWSGSPGEFTGPTWLSGTVSCFSSRMGEQKDFSGSCVGLSVILADPGSYTGDWSSRSESTEDAGLPWQVGVEGSCSRS